MRDLLPSSPLRVPISGTERSVNKRSTHIGLGASEEPLLMLCFPGQRLSPSQTLLRSSAFGTAQHPKWQQEETRNTVSTAKEVAWV